MNATEFAAHFGAAADEAAQLTGLSRWTCLTQWAFETGFAGANSGVPFNNLAGIRDNRYPLNAAGFSIYSSLDEFVRDYSAVLHQGNMHSVLAAAGKGPGPELAGFSGAQWVGTNPQANAEYAAHLVQLYDSAFAPLAGATTTPPAGPVVPPSSPSSGGLSDVDRDYLYSELVKIAHATGVTLDTPPWASSTQRTYTVKPGDSLSAIALQYLHDGNRWPEIYHLNEQVVGPNPDLIHPGQVLVLPAE